MKSAINNLKLLIFINSRSWMKNIVVDVQNPPKYFEENFTGDPKKLFFFVAFFMILLYTFHIAYWKTCT